MPVLSTPLTELLSATARPPLGSTAAELAAFLGELQPACDPVAVFRSLTRLLVPRICDGAVVWISVGGQQASAISCWMLDSDGCEPWTAHPDVAACCADPDRAANREDSIVVPFNPPPTDSQHAYQGVLTMTFAGLRPTLAHLLIGQLLVERAISLVQREQLQARAANLQCALNTNREIGAAMGIVMARHQLTADQAFDLLRRVSQHSHRKVVALAAEVVQTGMLELPEGVDLLGRRPTPGPPRRPHYLQVAR